MRRPRRYKRRWRRSEDSPRGRGHHPAAVRELREETGLDAGVVAVRIRQRYQVPDQMRNEYLAGVNEVAVENFAVQVSPGWEPLLNEEHDYYRWFTAPDAIAIAHWPETREVVAASFR